MPLSRLDPALEARLEQEVRRLGVTKSEFVKDALERVLGFKSSVDSNDFERYRLPDGGAFMLL